MEIMILLGVIAGIGYGVYKLYRKYWPDEGAPVPPSDTKPE